VLFLLAMLPVVFVENEVILLVSSKDLSTDVPSVAFAAPAQSVSRPFLASASSTLASAVVPGS